MLQNGYDVDLPSAADIWADYSNMSAASWLLMPENDDELWETIQHRI